MKEHQAILNIAAGNKKIDYPMNTFVINIDTMYYSYTAPEVIEKAYKDWIRDCRSYSCEFQCNENIFTFLERINIKFDEILCYRFLEHVSFNSVLYFIYLLSTVTLKDSNVNIIVPNYEILAKRILSENVDDKNFEKENIITTTELLNERSEPHSSIWTPNRAYHFFQLEDRFAITKINEKFIFDGRDIYLNFIATRIGE